MDPEVDINDIKLVGIFWNGDKSTAIINEQLVHNGDKFETYEVISIKKDFVVLNVNKKNIEVRMH